MVYFRSAARGVTFELQPTNGCLVSMKWTGITQPAYVITEENHRKTHGETVGTWGKQHPLVKVSSLLLQICP